MDPKGPEVAPLQPADRKRRGPQPKVAAPQVNLGMVVSAWQGLWQVLRFVLGLVGLVSDAKVLPKDEAAEDAKALLPIVERHPALARVLSWIGAPVVIVQRVAQHFHPRKKGEEKEKANGAGAARPAQAPPA